MCFQHSLLRTRLSDVRDLDTGCLTNSHNLRKELVEMAIFGFFSINITLLVLFSIVDCTILNGVDKKQALEHDDYNEDLFIKPLVDGKLFAQFQFRTTYRKDIRVLRWENKIEIFPLSLNDLILTTDLNELYFSLTKGNWNYKNWGYLNTPSPPGAQIRVRFSQHNENPAKSWNRLANSLAGIFCASLSSASDKKTLVSSKLIFNSYYSNLPEETLCTENLTPWKKLSPCPNSGLSSLLNAVNLFKSSYSSLSMNLKPNIDGKGVQLTRTIDIVFNPLQLFEGKQMWSLAKVFGNSISRKCSVSSHSHIYVDITNLDDKSKLYPQSYVEQSVEDKLLAVYDVHALLSNSSNQKQQLNVGLKQAKIFKQPPHSSKPIIPVHLTTHIVGVGAGDGTIVATVKNVVNEPVRITYLHVIPHFLPVYLHTLTIKTKSTGQELKPDKLNYNLSKDNSPTLIEFSLVVPPDCEIQISYDFERAFLRWSDYRPDANKGILLGSAMIDVAYDLYEPASLTQHFTVPNTNRTFKVFARPLLIILPTPDFSMPYNTICLVSSVLAFAFSPLYCCTTQGYKRRWQNVRRL